MWFFSCLSSRTLPKWVVAFFVSIKVAHVLNNCNTWNLQLGKHPDTLCNINESQLLRGGNNYSCSQRSYLVFQTCYTLRCFQISSMIHFTLHSKEEPPDRVLSVYPLFQEAYQWQDRHQLLALHTTYQSVVVNSWLMTPETIGPRMIALPCPAKPKDTNLTPKYSVGRILLLSGF